MADDPIFTALAAENEVAEDIPHWDDQPDLWDIVYLGGKAMPGVATIKVTRKRKIDKKSAKGKDKAKVTVQGYDPAEVTITLRMISREDKSALYAIMPLLEPVADKAKRSDKDALDIVSYATNFRDLWAVVIEELEGPELADGFLTLTIKAVEFHKDPKPAAGKGGGGPVKIGTFLAFDGEVLEGSRAAYQGPPDKDAAGKPVTDRFGNAIYVWSQVAVASGDGDGYTEAAGSFVGRFLAEDVPFREAWDKKHGLKVAARDDVTNTPDASKGADNGGKGVDGLGDPPKPPATTDAEP